MIRDWLITLINKIIKFSSEKYWVWLERQTATQRHMTDHDNLTCDKLFSLLAKNAKQIDEQSYSEFITSVLQLKEDDLLQFYLLTHFIKPDKCGHITLPNLQNLFDTLKIKTVKDLKKKLPALYQQLQKPAIFKEMYKNVYPLFLIGSTTLDIDYALALWDVLLKGKLNFLKELQEYVEELGQKRPKKIHKDLWNMMFEFANVVKNLDKDYNQNDAWPVFIDNLVEWIRNKHTKKA